MTAVSGEKGVYDVTMLLRSVPFGEWVTVYYDPIRINETKLLQKMRERGCPRANQVRSEGKAFTVMNPYIAAGDTVQIRLKPDQLLEASALPKGWKATHSGKNYVSVQVPKTANQGSYKIGKEKVVVARRIR